MRGMVHEVKFPRPDMARLQGEVQPRLARPYRILGLLAIGDIQADPDHLDGAALIVVNALPCGVNPARLTTRQHDTIVAAKGCMLIQRLIKAGYGGLRILGMKHVSPRFKRSDGGLRVEAEELKHSG